MSDKGGQQVGPSVGTFARLKQENRDLKDEAEKLRRDLMTATSELMAEVERLKKEAFDYRDGFIEASTELDSLRELQKAAETLEGSREWALLEHKPSAQALHNAIRKVRGMG